MSHDSFVNVVLWFLTNAYCNQGFDDKVWRKYRKPFLVYGWQHWLEQVLNHWLYNTRTNHCHTDRREISSIDSPFHNLMRISHNFHRLLMSFEVVEFSHNLRVIVFHHHRAHDREKLHNQHYYFSTSNMCKFFQFVQQLIRKQSFLSNEKQNVLSSHLVVRAVDPNDKCIVLAWHILHLYWFYMFYYIDNTHE